MEKRADCVKTREALVEKLLKNKWVIDEKFIDGFVDYVAQELDKARQEGFLRGYVECSGDRNMLEKWKSVREPKTTQIEAIERTEKKSEEILERYINLETKEDEK